MKAKTALYIVLGAVFALNVAAATPAKSDANHRRAICSEIVKIDLLLYDSTASHGKTATCSYTDERLLITPNKQLPQERMTRFVFLAFLDAGHLANDDFLMPPNVYVGYGSSCQVLTIAEAGKLQTLSSKGRREFVIQAMLKATQAPQVPCPK